MLHWVMELRLFNPFILQPDVVDLDISKIVFESNVKSFKYERFTPSGCKNIGIRKSEFVPIKDIIII